MTSAALGSLCPSLASVLGGQCPPAGLWDARGALLTCAMSSSSCSRWILARLYCSSSTSAKWAMLRMDSFSCSVSRMSWQGHRGHTELRCGTSTVHTPQGESLCESSPWNCVGRDRQSTTHPSRPGGQGGEAAALQTPRCHRCQIHFLELPVLSCLTLKVLQFSAG